MENDSKVSNSSLELMRPLPGTETIKREGLEANNMIIGHIWGDT